MALLQRAHRGFFLRHPLQLVLAILGIAIGVAAAVAVDLAVSSARSAFDASMKALLGSTTHQIVGSGRLVDESIYPGLRRTFPEVEFSPVVEGAVDAGGEVFRLSGIDVFAAVAGGTRGFGGASPMLPELLLEPATMLIARTNWDGLRLAAEARWSIEIGGISRTVRVLGPIEAEGKADAALEGLLLADIATAQELLGKTGYLDRIDLIMPDAPGFVARIAAALPPGLRVVSATARTEATGRLSSAFETNLRAMSMLGLIVGLFLIYNTMSFAVLQRRELIATLRLLGTTRAEILRELFVESLILGVLGGVPGLLIGVAAAEGLISQVTRTINDVYFVLTVKQLDISPDALLRGFLLGLIASFIAAVLPALEASGIRPLASRARSRAEDSSRRGIFWSALCGIGAVGLAVGVLWLPDPTLARSIGGLFVLLLGCGLVIPAVVWWLGLPARHVGAVSFRLALAGVTASLSRTGVAIAALAMAFAAALGVGAMTSSFRGTVLDWLEHLMQSDVYISSPAGSGGPDDRLPADLLERLAAIPGVTSVSAVRRQFVESTTGQIELVALQPSDPERPAYRFKDSGGGNAWQRFRAEEAVLVSEPFANRHHLAPGDFVELTTASGVRAFPVAGVFYDYRSDQGIVLINRALYQRYWRDDGVSSIGVSLAPELSADMLKVRLAQASGKDAVLQFRSNREIRNASLAVFDRTFAVTRVLRLLAVGVAVTGLIGSLLALQLERAREFAILRALGMTPGQLMVLVLLQSSVLGLTAGMLALPLGLLMAWVLVEVIQYVSFGWSMELAVPPDALWQTPLLSWAAALLAGLYPAWRAGRATPAAALRDE